MKEPALYRHSQAGGLVVMLCGVFALGIAYLVYHSRQFGPLIPLSVILLAAILFYRLTVAVDEEFVEIRFGPGVIRKKWRLAEIESCGPVRNRWWQGLGIHWIGKRTWLFNISGLDAVELRMKDGRIFRVGTDEPETLSELIQGRLGKDAISKL
jgi:hypothetical protein